MNGVYHGRGSNWQFEALSELGEWFFSALHRQVAVDEYLLNSVAPREQPHFLRERQIPHRTAGLSHGVDKHT